MAQLDTIINEVMLGAQDKSSIIFGKSKPLVVTVAKRGLQELFFSVVGQVRWLTIDVVAKMVEVPVDYVDVVRLSSLDSNNKLLPLYYDARKPIQYEYLRTNENNLILDTATGLPLKSFTPIDQNSPNYFNSPYPYNYGNGYGQIYGATGGYENGGGRYRWDPEARVWHVDNVPGDKVFLEYISNPLQRLNSDTMELDELFVETLKAYIVFTLVKYDKNLAASRIMMAKDEYNKLKKQATMRKRIKGSELKQAIKTQTGYKH